MPDWEARAGPHDTGALEDDQYVEKTKAIRVLRALHCTPYLILTVDC